MCMQADHVMSRGVKRLPGVSPARAMCRRHTSWEPHGLASTRINVVVISEDTVTCPNEYTRSLPLLLQQPHSPRSLPK